MCKAADSDRSRESKRERVGEQQRVRATTAQPRSYVLVVVSKHCADAAAAGGDQFEFSAPKIQKTLLMTVVCLFLCCIGKKLTGNIGSTQT